MRKKGRELRDAQGKDGPSTRSGQAVGGKDALPAFTPVPRRYRHDGWTPERQRAFIGALADTGCVTRAAAMVNMAQANCYTLRRAHGAEDFDRAWSAALDFGLKRLKDIAFERAIDGQLVPVFVGGKLMGFRRKRNDAILMFCLRHYGQDANGKRTTINYFSTRASAGAVSTGSGQAVAVGQSPHPSIPSPEGEGRSVAEASTTTVRTVINGPSTKVNAEGAAALLGGFEGVELDPEAEAAIAAALAACAARARAADEALGAGGEAELLAAADDPGESFVRVSDGAVAYLGELEPATSLTEYVPFVEGEAPWMLAGAEKPAALVAFEEGLAAKAALPHPRSASLSRPSKG